MQLSFLLLVSALTKLEIVLRKLSRSVGQWYSLVVAHVLGTTLEFGSLHCQLAPELLEQTNSTLVSC
jgi:hypothetical protein